MRALIAPHLTARVLPDGVDGTTPLTLGEVHAKIREYVDRKKLKKPRKPFTIYPDAKLGKILGEKPVSIFALAQPVNKHLTRVRA